MPNPASVADCYQALVGEPGADTCCKCIRIMIRRMQRDDARMPHELHFMTLATQLMEETKTFGLYIAKLYASVEEGEYASALNVVEVMVQHEAMLHEIAAGKPLHYGSMIN